MACISIIYDHVSALGKNKGHKYSGGGSEWRVTKEHVLERRSRSSVRKNPETTAAQNDIAMLLRGARNESGVIFRQDTTLVWIHVVRPLDPKIDGVEKDIDPINFQSLVCDAVEEGIGVNDSHFFSRVTWTVVKTVAGEKEKPRIIITVSQDDEDKSESVAVLSWIFNPNHLNNMDYSHGSGI